MTKQGMWNDRHKIVKPSNNQGRGDRVSWAGYMNGMKNRISDLFRTQAGLANHLPPVQDGFTSLSKDIAAKKVTEAAGELLCLELFNALKQSASNAPFDFPSFEFTVPSLQKTIYMEKTGGKVIAYRY